MEQNKRLSSLDRQRRRRRLEMHRRRMRFIFICAAAVVFVALLVKTTVFKSGGSPQEAAVSSDAVPVQTDQPAPKIPPASEENNLVKIAEGATGCNKKICYLTFDDGPTEEITVKVLEVLKQYDVKATFFMIGRMIDANRELARRVYNEGHLLANHSYSHDYKALYATGESFMEEIEKTYGVIKEVTGEEPLKLMRFPGGSYNAGDHAAEKQKYKELLKQNGYYYADWNCLNGDAESSNRTSDQLLQRLKETAGADNIVVLMHDAATKKSTAEALPAIIEYLKAQGYEFRRLDEIDYYGTGETEQSSSNNLSSIIM